MRKIRSFRFRKNSDSDRSKKTIPLKLRKGDKNRKTMPLKLRKGDKTKKTMPLKLRKGDKSKKTIPLKLRRKDKTKKEGPIKLQKPGSEDSNKLNISKWTSLVKKIGKNKSFLSIFGIIILIAVVAIGAGDYKKPSLNQNKNAITNITGPTNHYDNGVVSFDYPKGWNITSNPQPPLIVTVEQNENNSFSVLSENLEYSNFTQKVLEWKTNLQKNGMIYYEGITSVDGSDAYEIQGNYKPGNKIYSTRGIALVRGQTAYFIIFIFDKPLLDYKKEMDIVINSFHINQTS